MHGFNKRDHRMAGRGALYSLALLLNEAEWSEFASKRFSKAAKRFGEVILKEIKSMDKLDKVNEFQAKETP